MGLLYQQLEGKAATDTFLPSGTRLLSLFPGSSEELTEFSTPQIQDEIPGYKV